MLRLLILVCFVAVAPGLAVRAQPPTQGGGLASAPAPAREVSPDEARRALDILNDPQKRAEVTATLRAIATSLPPPAATPQAQAAPQAPPQAPEVGIPLAPDSLGAEVLVGASGFLSRLAAQTLGALRAAQSLPSLWAWLRVMVTDPLARGILLDTVWRLALAMAGGILIEWAVRRMVRRPILTLARRAPNGEPPPDEHDAEARAEHGDIEPPQRRRIAAVILLRRVPLVLGRLVLELLPVFGFLIAGHLIVATALGGEGLSRLVLLAAIDAYALYVAVMCLARMMFSPEEPRLRLLHISDAAASYATRWIRRIALVTVFGYAVAEAGFVLGLSPVAHEALLKAMVLVDHVFLAIIVLQKRRVVRRWLRPPQGSRGPVAYLRHRLARVWQWIALFFLAALWIVWAVEIPHGYALMVRYCGAAILAMILARVLQIVAIGSLDRMLHVTPETTSRYPGLDARLARYHPVLVNLVRVLILLAAIVVVLQLWGLGAFDWLLASALGQRVGSAVVTLALTVVIALAVWEAVNAAIERHLATLAREQQLARSARLRTLLPLVRSTLLITILVVAGMMVLSEIGVNIGPLLAGAGIVGVAIGFGSQTLVRDLITGIFLLLENAMQVGDAVTVSGLSGVVENLSVRTIRLRSGDGSVHIIPFSAVTTVTNVNRGLGNASVSVCVAYHEDTDHVCEVLKELAAAMRQEPAFSDKMLSDLQLWGVDKVDGAGVTIAGQMVCTDSGRWSVQREFNRRMKKRFEELGIELYNPVQRLIAMTQLTTERAQHSPEGGRP